MSTIVTHAAELAPLTAVAAVTALTVDGRPGRYTATVEARGRLHGVKTFARGATEADAVSAVADAAVKALAEAHARHPGARGTR